MRPALKSLLILMAFLSALAFQGLPFFQADADRAIESLVNEALKAWETPGAAVVVVRDDRVIYMKGHGVREVGSEQPVTPETLFGIASTTKAFTAAAIASLVDEGKMSWDDPVRKHLDYFQLSDPLAEANITIRDLLCHRSGLSRHDVLWYGSANSREEILRRIGQVKLDRPFRASFQYQNIMFLAAGQAAGAADRSSWEQVVQKRLFDPLGMTSANFSTTTALKSTDRATPHARLGGKLRAIEWKNLDNAGPAGSLNANVRDLSRWLRLQLGDGAFEGKRVLSTANLAEMHRPQMVIDMDGSTGVPSYSRAMNPETNVMTYGLGWVIQDFRGQLMLSHGGTIDGFRTQVVLLPKHRIGMAIVSNMHRTLLPESLRNGLTELLLDLPRRDWNAFYLDQQKKSLAGSREREKRREAERRKGTKPSRELAAYVGVYHHPAYGATTIAEEKEALRLRWSNWQLPLEHYHFDVFTARGPADTLDNPLGSPTIQFTLDADGNPATLSMLGVEFKRVKQK